MLSVIFIAECFARFCHNHFRHHHINIACEGLCLSAKMGLISQGVQATPEQHSSSSSITSVNMLAEPRICNPGVITRTQLFTFKREAFSNYNNEGAERSDHSETPEAKLHSPGHKSTFGKSSVGFSNSCRQKDYFQLCVFLVLSATGATPGK